MPTSLNVSARRNTERIFATLSLSPPEGRDPEVEQPYVRLRVFRSQAYGSRLAVLASEDERRAHRLVRLVDRGLGQRNVEVLPSDGRERGSAAGW